MNPTNFIKYNIDHNSLDGDNTQTTTIDHNKVIISDSNRFAFRGLSPLKSIINQHSSVLIPTKHHEVKISADINCKKSIASQEKIGWRPRMQTRLQTVWNFLRRGASGSRNHSEASNSAEKADRNTGKISKFSSKPTKSKNFLSIVFFVKKFIEIIKTYNIHQKLMRLKDYHYQVIDDRCFFQNVNGYKTSERLRVTKPFMDLWERTKRNRQIMKKIQTIKSFFMFLCVNIRIYLDKYLKVFSPENNIRILWDFIVLFCLVVNIFYIPLTISFDLLSNYLNFERFDNVFCNIIPNGVFMIDMVINMNTAYYSKGEYMRKRNKILRNYLKNQFFLDFVTILPVLLHWISSNLFWMKEIDTLSIFRLFKIMQLVHKMDEYLHLESKPQGFFNLFKILFMNLFVAHVCGCCWNYIGVYQETRDVYNNWLVENNLLDASILYKYITCFYWSVTTMITVGYGDIIAYTAIERVFAIIVMLMSCGVFAYSLNSVGSIFQEMYKKDNEFRAKIVDITYYMKKRNINKALQLKVKRYLEYMHEEEIYGYQRGTELIIGLSNKLQEEICEELYGKILRNLRIFKDNKFSMQFLQKLSLKMQEITFAPGDIIFLEKEEDENRLYFIMKGEIELFMKASGSKDNDVYFSNLNILKTGDYFGEYCFFSGKAREISAKSRHVANLCYINLTDFIEICKDFPEDFQRYCMMKDSLLLSEDISMLRMKCPSCSKLATHLIPKCSLLAYAPNTQSVIKKYLNRNNQRREIFTRNMIRLKFNSLLTKNSIVKNQQAFIELNSSKLGSPKNKARRPGVYDMKSFLNLSPFKHSNSIPLGNEEENSEISEEDEDYNETSPHHKVSYNKSNSFNSSKDSPNTSPFGSKVDDSVNIVNRMRNAQQFDPTASITTLSKSSYNAIQQDQLNRNIVNNGLPKRKISKPTIGTILKKSINRAESREKTRKLTRNPSNVLMKKPSGIKLLEKGRTYENFDSKVSLELKQLRDDLKSIQKVGSPINYRNSKLNGSFTSQDSESSDKDIANFEKVKNFTIFNPHNNIETQITKMRDSKTGGNSPKKSSRRRAELLMKFKKVVNTVKNSQRKTHEHDFAKKNDLLLKSMKNYYVEDPGSPETRGSRLSPIHRPYLSILDQRQTEQENVKMLRLEKVPMEKEETKEELQRKIGLANIIEEDNDSYDRGSLIPLERTFSKT